MKFKYLLATVALFTTPMTYAAPKAAPKTQPAPTYYGTQSYGSQSGGMDIGVMGPINLIGGTAYWGADVMVLWDLSSTLKGLSIGGETGFQFASIGGGMGWHAPILVTGIYQLDIAGLNNMKPFVGMGIGMGIVSSPGVTVLNINVGGGTSAAFELLVHAGVAFKPDFQGLFARLSLGTANSSFMFMPSVGYFF